MPHVRGIDGLPQSPRSGTQASSVSSHQTQMAQLMMASVSDRKHGRNKQREREIDREREREREQRKNNKTTVVIHFKTDMLHSLAFKTRL